LTSGDHPQPRHDALGYWIEEAGSPERLPPLTGEREADVVIVGGGYAGMWTAWHIARLEPSARVILLESEVCGHGPSGRNGGFCNTMWHSAAAMRDRFGDEGALRVAHAAEASVGAIGEFCSEQGIDAWFERAGYLEISTAAATDEVPERALAAVEALGGTGAPRAAVRLSPEEVAARCRSPIFRGGALYPRAATVQPARLAFGLRGALLEAGVEIYEGTRVRTVRPGKGIEARVEGGVVSARHAVIAAGAAAGARAWPGRNRLTVASSHIVLTEPVPDVLEEIGWTGGECITDARSLVHYLRTTPDGRIAFGWGGGRIAFGTRLGGRTELDPEICEQAGRDLRTMFPQLEGRRIERAWGGPIDASPSHLPVIVPTRGDRVFTAFGFTGNGVGPSHTVGRTLASLVLERRDEAAALPLVDPFPHGVPPEPARWIGGAAIRGSIARRERIEAEGGRAGPLTRAVSAIPAKIGFHIGR
jgi:glycine/D-amino acid oxidase-like deaminating enzyme